MAAFPGRAGLAAMSFLLWSAALPPPALARGEAHRIFVQGMAFSPNRLEVKAGDTVTWENRDLVPHNVTATNGAFRSPLIAPGRSWKFRVRKAGTFSYYCSLHPAMKAELIVKQPPASFRGP